MITYALAPSPKWYFLDAAGHPAAGGSLTTWKATDHSVPKFVFSDANGLFPYTDPIILDATGGTPVPMYWANDGVTLYYIVVKDAAGNIIFDLNNFPITGGGGVTPITTNVDIENHIVNGAFKFIDAATAAESIITPIPLTDFRMAPACGFFKDGSGAYVSQLGTSISGWVISKTGGAGETSSVQFIDVTNIGEGFPNAPSANATRYFRYTLSATGAPQTLMDIYESIPNVETFSGQTITVSLDIRSSAAGIGFFNIKQFFGTGGAASTPVDTSQNITFDGLGSWRRANVQIAVPSIVGKTKGTDLNDMIQAEVHFPLNATGTFDCTNIQVQLGTFVSPGYIYQTYNQDQYKVLIDLLAHGNLIFTTGELKLVSQIVLGQPPDIAGWIPLVDITQEYIGNPTSGARFANNEVKNLYIVWWNSFSDAECPVNGGRGANALADFNAAKTMKIPQHIIGTVLAASGLGDFGNNAFGDFRGEEDHVLTIGEMPSHHHTVFSSGSAPVSGGGGLNVSLAGTPNSGDTGGGAGHNTMQPTFYLFLYVKL